MVSESNWPQGYQLVPGSSLDRARLLTTMGNAYRELGATQLGHLAKTVEMYLADSSALWWLEKAGAPRVGFTASVVPPMGCLWLGQSINQLTGALQAYVYLVYVAPTHRRQGLGGKLMDHAKAWASDQGYDQLSLQVFAHNQAALTLYKSLGYTPTASLLTLEL
ncbi:GNAT family N-acetyltransferase [Leptolyngbya cf. ectocarpi LEGE 11479]|uniref:GNAT family N-acetyltransferase n=1 Tax=Leptolyngbya cf. ectocarpi LEGE 11479 TaxID=1828722 RepID=A0A928X077_LEPEC|nr:GNAT family N-acetyltransferase [Leptolyngbya ectocarpi]MBE9065525.1 GNAT family N-acetyltransferase [Leptolyngbya cf. ectocarpi LEGE 11479]